jgi:rare lipoprotein A
LGEEAQIQNQCGTKNIHALETRSFSPQDARIFAATERIIPDWVFEEAVVMSQVCLLLFMLTVGGLVGCTGGTTQCQKGHASFYSHSHDGCKTASGETYHAGALTAAHRKLPFGTKVRVKNLNNGREVTLRINDRGPFAKGRVIDVSEAAARKLGMVRAGVVPVEIVMVNEGLWAAR